jgi:hypothetical protein
MKLKYIYLLLIFWVIIIFIATFINPEKIQPYIFYLFPDYREIKQSSTKADELYKHGRKYEAFLLFKESIAQCKNRYFEEKLNIFYILSNNYKSEEYYYNFLEEIFNEQFIKGIGMKYKYSINDPMKIISNMMDIDTTRTQSLLSNIPEKRLNDDRSLHYVWYYYIVYNKNN